MCFGKAALAVYICERVATNHRCVHTCLLRAESAEGHRVCNKSSGANTVSMIALTMYDDVTGGWGENTEKSNKHLQFTAGSYTADAGTYSCSSFDMRARSRS